MTHRIVIVLAATVCAASLTACATNTTIADKLASELTGVGPRTTSLSDLGSADWTQFAVACPYDDPKAWQSAQGFEWATAPDLSQRDDVQVVAFLKDRSVVESAQISRKLVDFCGGRLNWKRHTRDTQITWEKDHGERWVAKSINPS